MILAFVFLAAIHTPRQCLVTSGKPVVTVEHGGKTYGFRYPDCREEFLSDPERYAQLYDALAELEAEGAPIDESPASLVPS